MPLHTLAWWHNGRASDCRLGGHGFDPRSGRSVVVIAIASHAKGLGTNIASFPIASVCAQTDGRTEGKKHHMISRQFTPFTWDIKTDWWDAGVVMCLGQGADLHMAQLSHCHSLSLAPVNPDWLYLPGFTFLVPAYLGSPGQNPRGP